MKLALAGKNEIFREGLAKLLQNEPDIDVVCTCRSALEAAESTYKHQPDVLLIDVELSESSSFELVQRIHKALPKMGIIVLTHSKADDDLISAVKAGAKAYLSKDVSLENLIKAIILVATGGVVVSPPMAERLLAELNLLEEGKDTTKLAILLSKREHEVLSLVARGLTNSEIATILFISKSTVKVHLRNVMEKLHTHTRQKAVALLSGKDPLPKVTQTDTKQV